MNAVFLAVASYLVIGALTVLLMRAVARTSKVLTPIALFMAIEVLAVWPALIPTADSTLADVGPFPAMLAAVGMLLMVVTYVILGGPTADATGWRDERRLPTHDQTRSMALGLKLLVAALVVLGLYAFHGLPPLLTGGFESLLDPVGHEDQAALIRETRLSLTKGHTLLGEDYAGQGIINAASETGWRVAVIVSVLLWTWTRTKRHMQLLLFTSFLAFIFLGSAGSRSPLLLCVVAGVAALAIRHRLKTKNLVTVAVVAISFTLLIMPLSKGASGGESPAQRLTATIERVTDGNGENNAQIVHLISSGSLEPEHGGLFIERLQAMVPGISAQDPFALRVTRLAYGTNNQTTGYSTPTQYGLLYADGGPAGVLAGYLLSGALLALAWRRIVRIRSPLGAAVAVEGTILLGYLSVTGIHGVLATAPVAAFALLIAAGPYGWRRFAAAAFSAHTDQEVSGPAPRKRSV